MVTLARLMKMEQVMGAEIETLREALPAEVESVKA